jgi:hypothetical protein
MNETPTNKPGRRISRALLIWLASFTLIALALGIALITTDSAPKKLPDIVWSLLFGVLGASILVCLLVFIHWLGCWRNLRRALVGLAIFATLIALFYTEEDWRGKRAWENCKRELEAKGAVLDWDKYIPPPVPDDQNFFKSPKMQEWFQRNSPGFTASYTNELYGLLTNADKVAVITNATAAANFLAWSDQFQPDLDLIRDALKRPYARMDGNYSRPFGIPIPNFVSSRILAQALAQRAKCHLLFGQPEKALREVMLLNDSRHLLERAPTGKPMLLVDAMVNVTITELYVNTIADGLQKQAWQEPQLAALQKQLEKINLPQLVVESFNTEQAASTCTLETTPGYKVADLLSGVGFSVDKNKTSAFRLRLKNPMYLLILSAPRGWVYLNMVTDAQLLQKEIEAVDTGKQLISPRAMNNAAADMNATFGHASPYNYIAAMMIPNFIKAWQTTAKNQTLVNEAQVVCALERYHLTHGEYPETLDALVPQFIEKLPHDVIGGQPSQGSGSAGQPLHYRRTADGKFVLYSVGWNETDDGGTASDKMDQGDWVWKN